MTKLVLRALGRIFNPHFAAETAPGVHYMHVALFCERLSAAILFLVVAA